MLTLTETASSVVKTIVAQSPSTETGGLRIQGAGTQETEFQVSVVPQPEMTDSVVERDGARVFLEPGAAIVLDDKVLDAQVAEDGSVRFAISPQQA